MGGKETGGGGGEVWIVRSPSTSPTVRDAQQAAHLGVGVEQGKSQSPVLCCTLDLSFMRQCKCV